MTTPFKRKALPLLIATLALAVSGCSGGGDNPATGITGVNLDGTAAKGIINKGNVLAEELSSSGAVIRPVGNTTTGADGSYAISVASSYEGGPIQVTISAGADTEMKCDIPASSGCGASDGGTTDTNANGTVDFGEWYKPGSGSLTMTALVAEAAASDKIKVNITPFTDLAARRAKASGTVDKAAVYNANSEVSNLLGGIDILNTKPLDITDPTVANSGSSTEIAYAAFGAAIASLANASSGKPDLDAALATLSASFDGGKILGDDDSSEIFSLQDLIDEAEDTFAKANIIDTYGVIAALQLKVAAAGTGFFDPEPSTTAGSPTLTKVKTFVGDVRTWGTVIAAEMKVKGDAFDQQTSLASDAADMSAEFLISPALEAALDAIMFNAKGTYTGSELSSYGILGFTSGTISKSNDVITITNGVIGSVTVNMSASVPVEGQTTSSSITIGITSATFRSAAADADINKGTVVLNLASPYNINYTELDAGTASIPDISGASIDLDISLTQKQNSTEGALSTPVTFAGTLSTTLANPIKDAITNAYTWITPSTLTLGGKISSSAGHSMEATFTANIANASTFTPVGETLSNPNFVLEGSGAGQWLDATVGLNFGLQLEGLPKASINITGDRTGFKDGIATITIAYGIRQIVINGTVTDGNTTGNVEITNQDGVKMTITQGADKTGTLTFNGTAYGTIEELSNGLVKITYTDGTFETL